MSVYVLIKKIHVPLPLEHKERKSTKASGQKLICVYEKQKAENRDNNREER